MLTVKKLRVRGASGEAEFSYGGAVVYAKTRAEAADGSSNTMGSGRSEPLF